MPASTVPMVNASGRAARPEDARAPQRPRSGYRVGGRPARVVALGATVLVHIAVGAVVAFGWPHIEDSSGSPHLASIVILPTAMDEPRRRPVAGRPAAARPPEPLPALGSPPPTILLAPPTPAAIEMVAEPPAAADGGREDALAMATQAYRRAVMARLEAQRRPIRRDAAEGGAGGEAGVGAVSFRIERSGRLLDASIQRSTGRPSLDRAALTIVRRAAPFPAIPDALPDELEVTLPVEFVAGPHLLDRALERAGQ